MKALMLAVADFWVGLLVGVVPAVGMWVYVQFIAPAAGLLDLRPYMTGTLVLGWGIEIWRKKDWRMLLPIVLGALIIWLSPNRP